ncbi:CPBP family intramembrane glutamic endopeptidase [Halovenus rubra]|uniref:CPBP family intramembrane glutamic endopeptidase n=2 Tax=Halovenus rubra TaxID=869890 RepID=A0ACC7E0T1_9EURY|nr:CPBP family intramembrane glutamic endopeptidase [Halovenus rubra]
MPTTAQEDPPRDDPDLVQVADPNQRLQSLTHALLLVAGAFLAAGVVQQFGLLALDGLGLTEESAPLLTQLVPMALHFATFILVGTSYLLWRNDRGLVPFRFPTSHDVRWILLGFAVLVASLVTLEFVLSQLGLEPAQNTSVEIGNDQPELFLYYIPLVILLNAPGEELLFRGVVQGVLRTSYGVIPGIIGAAVIFGAVHYVALVGTGSRIAYVLVAFVSGLVLGALHEYTENLLVPVSVHACWNVVIYLNLYVGATNLL